MKRTCSSSGSELTEYSLIQFEGFLNHEMLKIVWHPSIETRCRFHGERGHPFTKDDHVVLPFAGPVKLHAHH